MRTCANQAACRPARAVLFFTAGLFSLTGCGRLLPHRTMPVSWTLKGQRRSLAEKIVAGARAEAQRGVRYNASYQLIAYPGGDVRPDRGACTDVVIRALRHAGYDLQPLIHEDMQRHFDRYPHRYGLDRPDPSIDHRRAPNQIAFLRRHGRALPLSTTGPDAATWQPGDIVYWQMPHGPEHCGIVSDRGNAQGLPLVIHNMHVTEEADCLTAWPIVGHFRYPR